MTFTTFAQWSLRATTILIFGLLIAFTYHIVIMGMMGSARMSEMSSNMPCNTLCITLTESEFQQIITTARYDLTKQVSGAIFVITLMASVLFGTQRARTFNIFQRLQYYYRIKKHYWHSYMLYPSLFGQGILAARVYA